MYTRYQSGYLAHKLSREGAADDALTQTIAGAKVNMNPHQMDAALFALASPLSNGVILSAVFEAIVNAVAHRDYAMRGARIRLHMFADPLELSTPGGLPNGLTVDSMEANSITLNETLVNLLSLYYPSDPLSKRQNLIERRADHPDVRRKPVATPPAAKRTACWRSSALSEKINPFLMSHCPMDNHDPAHESSDSPTLDQLGS